MIHRTAAGCASFAVFLVAMAATGRLSYATDQVAERAGGRPGEVIAANHSARTAMAERIDGLLAQQWEVAGIVPAPPASDSEFLRRASLDLTGVTPRVWEVREFLADATEDKRARLIERLLGSPRYATHMATMWRNRLLPADAETGGLGQVFGVQNWLAQHFAKNTRFDNVIADLLVATDGSELGPALYYQAHDLAPEKLAASTAELFLGMRLHCAQCHDHPYDDWTQRDFWGFAAFFARVRGPDAQSRRDAYRLYDAQSGDVTLPGSDEVVPAKYLGGRLADEAEGGTRRLQLAIWVASRENAYLARATANWAWAHLFGRGLVDPVGDEGAHNPPSHPQLLNELAAYLVQIEFDLHEFWRTLAATRAYQLSSHSRDLQTSPPHLFARMNVKPLTPEQLYDSLVQAAPPSDQALDATDARTMMAATNVVLDPRRAEFIRRMRSPSQGTGEFSSGILQALLLINGGQMTDATSPDASRLLGALDAPFLTDEQRVEALFLATLSRPPSVDEFQTCLAHLKKVDANGERDPTFSDILWSLLNSTEFAFNH